MNRLLLLLVTFMYSTMGLGQMRMPQPEPRFLHLEPVNLASDDSTLSRVDIFYRIDAEFFVPVKNTDTTVSWNFLRRGEIVVELFDSTGESKVRDMDRIEIGENSSEHPPDRITWHEGVVSFNVPPGTYTILVQADDLDSKRSFVERNSKVTAAPFSAGSLGLSTPLFVRDTAGSALPSRIIPQNMGGDLLFGTSGGVFVELIPAMSSDAPVTVECSIMPAPSPKTEGTKPLPVLTGRSETRPVVQLKARKDGVTPLYDVVQREGSRLKAVLVPLELQTLLLRSYVLAVTARQGSIEKVVTRPFQLVWPDMPRSLRDVDYALDALRYIISEQKLDSLKQGNWESRRDSLEAFWQARNLSPRSAYNDVMTQYYRRVDYAGKTFGTLRQADGFKTDRGRIFVIYGPPTKTERTLSPAEGFQEVWIYERLHKKFVFTDENKSGNYVLVPSGS